MNNTIQTLLTVLALLAALVFLIKKFLLKSKPSNTNKACPSDNCGCK